MKNIKWRINFFLFYLVFKWFYSDTHSLFNIAVAKLVEPIKENKWTGTETWKKLSPICLPDKNFKDIGQTSFILSAGKSTQGSCYTDDYGPAPWRKCAREAVIKHEGKTKKFEERCNFEQHPSSFDGPCNTFFHKIVRKDNRTGPVALQPKDGSKKPYPCYGQWDHTWRLHGDSREIGKV